MTAAVYDDVTGRTSLYRPGTAEDTASIMKVDILATLLAQDQAAGQALTPADQALAQSMIEESDNDDAQSLWDEEGGAAAVGSVRRRGRPHPDDARRGGVLGPVDDDGGGPGAALRTVAYPNDVLTPASQGYELGLMSHVEADQAWGVSAGVGAGRHGGVQERMAPPRQRGLAGEQHRLRRRRRSQLCDRCPHRRQHRGRRDRVHRRLVRTRLAGAGAGHVVRP